MVPRLDDLRVRMAAFAWLAAQTSARGEVLPWSLLLGVFGASSPTCPDGARRAAASRSRSSKEAGSIGTGCRTLHVGQLQAERV